MIDAASRRLLQEVATIVDQEAERTSIKATCAGCASEGEYQPSAFHLTALETTHYVIAYRYEFFCLKCHVMSSYQIDGKTFEILRGAGVAVDTLCGPDEIAEIYTRQEAPLVTEALVSQWVHQLTEHEEAVQGELSDANGG